MIKRADVHQAIDEGMLDAIKDRSKMEALNLLSEPKQAAEGQFAAGLKEIKEACEGQHAVVDDIFPE